MRLCTDGEIAPVSSLPCNLRGGDPSNLQLCIRSTNASENYAQVRLLMVHSVDYHSSNVKIRFVRPCSIKSSETQRISLPLVRILNSFPTFRSAENTRDEFRASSG